MKRECGSHCPRCRAQLCIEERGVLLCLACGERLYHRHLLYCERLADVANEVAERDDLRALYERLRERHPELTLRPRWDALEPLPA